MARLRPDAILLSRSDLDVTDAGAVAGTIARYRPSLIVHGAAWTVVDGAEADPDGAWAVNVGGTEAVARAAAAAGALLVYPSTDYVFAGDTLRPYREHDPLKPRTVYGRTKVEAENAARTSPRHLIVRTSWLFGDGTNFVKAILGRARGRAASIDVVADQTGLPTSAVDLAEGMLALAEGGFTRTFHLAGGGSPCSWADFAEAVLAAAHGRGMIERIPLVRRITTDEWRSLRTGPVAERPRYSVLDCSRAEAAGVRLRPWPEALEEYMTELASDRTGEALGGRT
jgi:dTDP-4-dehydrorhamnose reductase